MKIQAFTTFLAAGLLTVAASAQQDVACTQSNFNLPNLSCDEFLTFSLSGGSNVHTAEGTFSVLEVNAPDCFEAASIRLSGATDMRVNGTNIFGVISGVQAEVNVRFEVRTTSNQLLVSAERNFSGGASVPSFLTFWSINFPSLTGTSTESVSPSQWAAFIGAGSQTLRWRMIVDQNIFASGGTQQVQLDTFGSSMEVEICFDGSDDYQNLGGFTAGGPQLYAQGPTLPDAGNKAVLFAAPENAVVAVAANTIESPLPIFGGTLFPAASDLLLASTDANGHLVLPYNWPAVLLPGETLAVQTGVFDPLSGAWLLSNALRGTSQ